MKTFISTLLIFSAPYGQAQQTKDGSFGITEVEKEQGWSTDVQGLINH